MLSETDYRTLEASLDEAIDAVIQEFATTREVEFYWSENISSRGAQSVVNIVRAIDETEDLRKRSDE